MAEVTIYTRKFCGYCSMAKRLLEEKNVDYVEHDATMRSDIKRDMIARANGQTTFPQIFINEKHIGGYDDLYAIKVSGKLDELLAK